MTDRPAIRIEPTGVASRDALGWRTTWRVFNGEARPIHVLGATAPHSHFHGETTLDLEVAGAGSAVFSLVVHIEGAVAGDEIENAFVILLVDHEGTQWRVLARLRVPLAADRTPEPRVESITVQRVGFSGEL